MPPALVVLSGCGSGIAEAPRGSGLLGLTRAWLASGAAAVVATQWPTPDDSGTLLRSFYRHLRDAAPPAVALQRAQTEMLRVRAAGAPNPGIGAPTSWRATE